MPISIDARRRVGLFGFGVEGRAALAWLSRRGGHEVTVISAERPRDLRGGIPWFPDREPAALTRLDVLVKSPGVKPSHPLLVDAELRGIPRTTPTNIFMEVARAADLRVVGVTGSKGKSTTATLIHRTLEAAGIRSVLVGNIGAAALEVLDEALASRAVVVFEMSSYQTHDLVVGPPVAVVTRLFPEHLDWHGGVDAYYASKLNVARSQRPSDVTVWNASDEQLVSRVPLGPARHVAYGARDGVAFAGGVFRRSGAVLFTESGMRLRGIHNRLNAAGAFTAAEMLGAAPEHIQSVLESFEGLPHRLEDLGVHGAVRWINDSIATAPEAAVAAIESLGPELATYIGGGTDRGFDFGPLARKLIARGVANIILLPPGAPRMLAAIAAIDEEIASRVILAADLAEAVSLAAESTPTGQTALFSPASPSYGIFRNFEERGDTLRALVGAL
jgi:UDP-N-acetylmuramoyl-L-alanine---L-glutamate ligase